MSFKFEQLDIWKRSIEISLKINDLVKTFPADERFVLSSQIKRAADSISLNIAEGSTGQTNKEFNRFLGIALRSGIEVVSCLYLAKARKIISVQLFDELYSDLLIITKMIQSLRRTLIPKPKAEN